MHRTFTDLADDLRNPIRIDAILNQSNGTIDKWLTHGAASIGLEGKTRHFPRLTQAVGNVVEVGSNRRVGKSKEEPMLALEDGSRAIEAILPQERSPNARLCCPAGV